MREDYWNRIRVLAEQSDKVHRERVSASLERRKVIGERVDLFFGLAPIILVSCSFRSIGLAHRAKQNL